MEKTRVLHLEELEMVHNDRADEITRLRMLAETRGGQLEEVATALEKTLLEVKISKVQLEDSQGQCNSA